MKKNSKKKTVFGRFLLIWVLILLLAGSIALDFLWNALRNYQADYDAAQLEAQISIQEAQRLADEEAETAAFRKAVSQAPQLCFLNWYDSMTGHDFASAWISAHADIPDSPDAIEALFSVLFDKSTLSCYKAETYTPEMPMYVLKSGDRTLSHVTLQGSELNWEVADFTLEITADCSASICVPSGAAVFCNGFPLDESLRGVPESRFPNTELAELAGKPVEWVTWSISGLLCEPELTATLPEGLLVDTDEIGSSILCAAVPDSDLSSRAVAFVQDYLYYFMKGRSSAESHMKTARNHTALNSPAARKLTKTLDGVSATVSSDYITDIDVSKCTVLNEIIWSDHCHSIDVDYDADCKLYGEAYNYADETMRVFFILTENGWELYDFETV